MKSKMLDLQRRLEEVTKTARNSKLRESRVKASCKVCLEEMKQKDLLTAELEEKLLSYRGKILNLSELIVEFLFT